MRVPVLVSLLSLLGGACSRPAPPQPQAAIGKPPRPPLNCLLFAGDVMLSRGVRRAILAAHDPALPFRRIAPLLASADVAFINLESPFSDHAPYHEEGLIFHAPPESIAGLMLAGVDLVSTANNHSRDCASHGVEYTVRWLQSHGISPLGSSDSMAETHRGVVLVRRGVRFGFLGYTFDQKNGNWPDMDNRIATTDRRTMQSDVASLKKRCDVVIVSMHSGVEYAHRPNQDQIQFAHAAIDAGATLVVGHHPHVVQPMEFYKNGVIYYSLGNFVFDQFQRMDTQHGEIAEVYFLGPYLSAAQALPVKITSKGPELESGP